MGKVISIVEEIISPFLTENSYELVDIEYVKEGSNWFLRIFVDKEGGVIDIDDCGAISEFVSEKLDELDPIPDAYFLEVSSPGAERPLKKERDFEKAVGKHVFVVTNEAVESFTEFEGVLEAFEHDELIILMNKKKYNIPLHQIHSARLAIVL